ncbi:MAG: DUF58 domain-containing protein [Anaerolineae bacterium]|nr:DUF58 domain-containing protein [Anaerolineae bacterium]
MARSIVVSTLLFLIVLTGVALLNGPILALALPLVLYLGAGVLFGPEPLQLTFEHRLDNERVAQGTPVTVTVTVTNHGRYLEEVQIRDHIPDTATVLDGHTAVMTSLRSGESVTLTYSLDAARGFYEFGTLTVEATDRLGIFRRQATLTLEESESLFVVPPVRTVGQIPIRPMMTRVFAGYIPARIGGPGIEFFGVRGYQPGDSLRHINWRANARHPGNLYTNEFEQERVADVGLILDGRMRAVVHNGNQALFDQGIMATAALADSFLTSGNRVSLLLYGHYIDWTLPGYGKLQREKILQSLARATVGDSQVFERLQNIPARLFPSKSQLVLISPLLPDDVQILRRLRSQNYKLMVVSPDPLAFEESLMSAEERASEATQIAIRIARLERALLFRQLRQAGIQVVNWRIDEPLDQVIRQGMVRPVMRDIGGLL